MAPPGTKTVAHLKPQQRASWAKHGVTGWYIGPSFKHYRCYRIFIPKTKSERIVDTVELFSTHTKTPTWSANQEILLAAENLTLALQHPQANITHLHQRKLQALKQKASISNPKTSKQTTKTSLHIISPPRVPTIVPTPPPRVPTQTTTPPRVDSTAPTHPHLIPPDDDPDDATPATILPTPSRPTHRYMTRSKYSQAINVISVHEIYNKMQQRQIQLTNAIIDPISGKNLEYRHLISNPDTKETWVRSCANEFGRLCQGVGNRIKGTNTLFFIPKNKVPKNKTVTYPRIVCDYRPTKSEPNRIRITVGGNLITYTDEVYTSTAGLMTAKILINSILSTDKAKCACFDIKDFYLNSHLKQYEYMRFRYADIPPEIKQQYKLDKIVHTDGFVYTEIRKGMYGLPQAGIVANKDLQKHLAPYGYHPVPHTPGLWKHETRDIIFTLVVDDFAIKYTHLDDLHHLQKALQDRYTITIDLEAELYCGVKLNWDYKNRKCTLTMPGYIEKLLHKVQHPLPKKPVHSPHRWTPPQYGATIQTPVQDPKGQPVTDKERRWIQSVIGSLLYYARAVDPTLLPAINTIAMQQTIATENTIKATKQLLDFVATYPNSALTYTSSDMILHVHSDASYLSAPKARSRVAGYFHLTLSTHDQNPLFNAPIHVESKVLRHVMSSAAEAELGALFENCKIAEVIRTTLEEMGHLQSPTAIVTDNFIAHGIANNNLKVKQSKTMDMRFFWVRDRVKQNHFKIHWEKGKVNRADYFTKHHSAAHHKRTRPLYINDQLQVNNSLQRSNLRGCINPITTYVHNILRMSQDKRHTSSNTRINVHNTTYVPNNN